MLEYMTVNMREDSMCDRSITMLGQCDKSFRHKLTAQETATCFPTQEGTILTGDIRGRLAFHTHNAPKHSEHSKHEIILQHKPYSKVKITG